MRESMQRAIVLILLFSAAAGAATTLYAIGPDGTVDPDLGNLYVPRRLFQVPTSGTYPSPVWYDDIGTPATGYTGGLAWDAAIGLFYAIGNDSSGGTLVSFAPGMASSPSPGIGLTGGVGWNGGLALDSDTGALYAIGTDAVTYIPALYQLGKVVTKVADIGDGSLGFHGGLTYDSSDGFLYSIASDSEVNATMFRLSLAGSATPVPVTLGQGYQGGIAYDPAVDVFYALRTDPVYGYLETISLAGSGSVTEQPLGGYNNWGYWDAGLTLMADEEPGTIPEPSAAGLALAGLPAGICLRKGKSIHGGKRI